jgi:hypothetical protein
VARKDPTEMITLSQAERETGVPITTLRWYIRTGKMWAEKRKNELGVEYWVTARMEAERAAKLYHPHSR